MLVKKIDILRGHMQAGRWDDAIRLAAKFPRLGEHKVAITRAADAINHPDFHRQLGRDIQQLVEAGKAALIARYH